MKAGALIIGPLLFSFFISILFVMLLRWFKAKGLSHRLSLIMVIGIFLATVAGFFLIILVSALQLAKQVPLYQAEMVAQLNSLLELVNGSGVDIMSIPVQDIITWIAGTTGTALTSLADIFTAFLIVLLTTIFLIIEATGFTDKISVILRKRPEVGDHIRDFGKKIVDYLVIRTEVNMVTGVGVGVILTVLGVDFALLWGFLAFLLSFIPYLGFWLAVLPPMLLAWAELGPAGAAIFLVGAIIVDVLADDVIFPQLAGFQLQLSPVIVFIAVIFWWWVLGVFGMLLAVPLTLLLKLIVELWDETRWMGEFIGTSGLNKISVKDESDE